MRILLLSDVTLCANAGGISQTLYNILLFCKPENLLCIVPKHELEQNPPTAPFKQSHFGYLFNILPTENRFKKKVLQFNFYINALRNFGGIKAKIKSFNPDVIIVCPNGAIGLFMYEKLLLDSTYKVYPYLMDDWMNHNRFKWKGGSVQVAVQNLLRKNNSWFMIGNELADILAKRYNCAPKRVLAIRNPVSVHDAPMELPIEKKNVIHLSYAGAMWPMHKDALFIMAAAVQKLQEHLDVRITVYTRQIFWEINKLQFESFGVSYGGDIAYNKIHDVLSRADGLIITSSFDKDWESHSKGSVQTKLTDYLKVRRPIISCGPHYSANHNFLKQNDCGFCIETPVISDVAKQLNVFLLDIVVQKRMVANGWQVLEQQLATNVVHQKLIDFIKA